MEGAIAAVPAEVVAGVAVSAAVPVAAAGAEAAVSGVAAAAAPVVEAAVEGASSAAASTAEAAAGVTSGIADAAAGATSELPLVGASLTGEATVPLLKTTTTAATDTAGAAAEVSPALAGPAADFIPAPAEPATTAEGLAARVADVRDMVKDREGGDGNGGSADAAALETTIDQSVGEQEATGVAPVPENGGAAQNAHLAEAQTAEARTQRTQELTESVRNGTATDADRAELNKLNQETAWAEEHRMLKERILKGEPLSDKELARLNSYEKNGTPGEETPASQVEAVATEPAAAEAKAGDAAHAQPQPIEGEIPGRPSLRTRWTSEFRRAKRDLEAKAIANGVNIKDPKVKQQIENDAAQQRYEAVVGTTPLTDEIAKDQVYKKAFGKRLDDARVALKPGEKIDLEAIQRDAIADYLEHWDKAAVTEKVKRWVKRHGKSLLMLLAAVVFGGAIETGKQGTEPARNPGRA